MLNSLEQIHDKAGIIHRDIKPGNTCVGLSNKSCCLHIIDFGVSENFINKRTGCHINMQKIDDIVGTSLFCSIKT